MAAESQPSEEQTAGLSSAVKIPTAAAAQAQAPSQAEDQLAPENAGPPLSAPKRQRRPSVRLGEIGEHQPPALAPESHVRRPKWRLPKDAPSRKARSLTHLANGNGDSDFDPAHKKPKAKRGTGMGAGFGLGTAAKRVRSSWTSKPDDAVEHNTRERDWEIEEEEEGEEEGEGGGGEAGGDRRGGGFAYRDFERSPVPSADEDMAASDSWQRRGNQAPESDNRERRVDGVRSWLMELGLSRYAPIFEVHEVDDEVLPMLTLEDLKDMGINAVGSRRKMYSSILKLRKGFSFCVTWGFRKIEHRAEDDRYPNLKMQMG